jgi:hypothetical protein
MKRASLALGVVLGALTILVFAGSGAAAVPKCPSFSSQAEAQEAFLELGGKPRNDVGGLDGNGNGVACEALSGPYVGYATIGFNKRRGFLYGVATLPLSAGGYKCLVGNHFDPETVRRVHVYRERPGPDKAILGDGIGTAVDPDAGRLVWKAVKPALPPGRYYASFEARIATSPYGRNPCPGFESRPALLPVPKKKR